ncbi:hypothetical protein [Bradyrhizobium sp. 200]|uniref:hypothetical protein n=1 Tax=Bradyrhizobium sp. 200 TaxID=2782665 RepID=UPI001FFEBF60|nr:hypothetical protein [Bradyrhizobium sp. 200]
MTVRDKGGSQYVCNHLKIQRGAPECQNLRAGPIDAQVAAAFLQAVAPAEIDALSKARKTQLQSERAMRQAEEQQVERLRYQAALPLSRSASSIAPTRTIGSSPANWKNAGKPPSWRFDKPRRR